MRLLDADAEGADWQEVARIALHIDPIREPVRSEGIRKPFVTREMGGPARLPAALARRLISFAKLIVASLRPRSLGKAGRQGWPLCSQVRKSVEPVGMSAKCQNGTGSRSPSGGVTTRTSMTSLTGTAGPALGEATSVIRHGRLFHAPIQRALTRYISPATAVLIA
jgi:hypothetical protein